MDKYFKIENLINEQKKKKEKILEIFQSVLGFSPKIEIVFGTINSEKIKIKIIDKSSVRFIVLQKKEEIVKSFNCEYPDTLVIN
jgi:hypothetical protein